MDKEHQPVLLREVIDALALRSAGVYVDATYGRGGHCRAILAALGPDGRVLAIDRDPEAVAAAELDAARDSRLQVLQGSFGRLRELLREAGVGEAVQGIVLDLGVSSPQLDQPVRGFSFRHDGPLDMRMDPAAGCSAADWLADASEKDIGEVLRSYGEERQWRRIARAIVAARQRESIRRTAQLAQIVAAAHVGREPGRDPATRTFQALRIHVNRELQELEACLPQAVDLLAEGGRLCVISFHSLEDRIVKRFMRAEARGDEVYAGLPDMPPEARPRLRLLGRGIRPSAEECDVNPRARSAVLRAAERLT